MYHTEKLISRILLGWQIFVITMLGVMYQQVGAQNDTFYRFGPSSTFLIMGFVIDTNIKYTAVILYSMINTIIKSLYHNILASWIINYIQNTFIIKPKEITGFAYETISVTTLYVWIDWYIYINILLAQMDMMIVELSCDVIMSLIVTRYYLHYKLEEDKTNELYETT